MISYSKLRNLLKSKNIGIGEFTDKYNIALSRILSGSLIPGTDIIERICTVLQCDINDIMEYTDKTPTAKFSVQIDYDKLGSLINDKGLTKYKLSIMMGKKSTFIGDKFLLKNKIRPVDLDKLLSILDCSLEDIQ